MTRRDVLAGAAVAASNGTPVKKVPGHIIVSLPETLNSADHHFALNAGHALGVYTDPKGAMRSLFLIPQGDEQPFALAGINLKFGNVDQHDFADARAKYARQMDATLFDAAKAHADKRGYVHAPTRKTSVTQMTQGPSVWPDRHKDIQPR